MSAVRGSCDPAFAPVGEAFEENLGEEIGAAVVVLSSGRPVVDLVGGWADEIKSVNTRPDDDETKRFLDDPRNRRHKTWHYVDLPLGADSYAQAAELGFTRDDDVVQTIKECVRVLQGMSDRFSQLNALRLIGHLAGDILYISHNGNKPVQLTTGMIAAAWR